MPAGVVFLSEKQAAGYGEKNVSWCFSLFFGASNLKVLLFDFLGFLLLCM